jgi:hypothetical protein
VVRLEAVTLAATRLPIESSVAAEVPVIVVAPEKPARYVFAGEPVEVIPVAAAVGTAIHVQLTPETVA